MPTQPYEPRTALLERPGDAPPVPVAVAVDANGLCLAPRGPGPGEVRIDWRSLEGLQADHDAEGPDGSRWQQVVVVADGGRWVLRMRAPDVAHLMSALGSWSWRWSRSRAGAGGARRTRRARATLGAAVGAALTVLAARPGASRTGAAPRRGATGGGLAAGAVVAARAGVPLRLRARATRPAMAWAVRRQHRRSRAGAAGRTGGPVVPVWRAWRVRVAASVVAGVALVAGGASTLLGSSPSALAAHRSALGAEAGDRLVLNPLLEHAPARSAPGAPSAQAPALPPATATPAPAPPSLVAAPPLSPHEVFAFAPYWTLPQSSTFDVQGLTTIAYFSIDVNANGTLDRSGGGWEGYQSQALVDLVDRAHAAGDRVVLTVNDFGQGSLDQLTSSKTAAVTLAHQLIAAVQAKNLDGVNLDLEGEGAGDQAGLTALVAEVSSALHAVDPSWQVTMDTYASSAGDPAGFYDIRALAPYVDAFFVMAYQLNLQAKPTPASPLTSSMFTDLATAEQYAAAVNPAKVIMGLPFFGYDWPTADGTMHAKATGGATPVTYAQAVSGGHPQYWDPVTDTAWTSFQVGTQWHEIFYEDAASLYKVAQVAQWFHLGGVGIWALGMDGPGSGLEAALDGFATPTKLPAPGPAATSPSNPTTTTSSTTTTAPGHRRPPPRTTTTTTSTTPTSSTTTTTTSYTYAGTWQGQAVTLAVLAPAPTGSGQLVGQLTGFATDDPALQCLAAEPSLDVYQFAADPGQDVVVAATPADCADAVLAFTPPAPETPTTTG